MSGILGVWNRNGQPVDRAMLARLGATLAHRGPDGAGQWIDGPIGLACRLLRITPEASTEVQPVVQGAGSGSVLVFDGRLDNREDLLRRLPDLSPACPDPALVLAAYESWGPRCAESLVGDFALGLFDPRRQHLLLVRDAIGIRPLYYSHVGQIFVFASEVKAILAHPAVSSGPDDEILAGYVLDSARTIHDRTCFKNVFSLPPAHLAILSPQQLVIRRYWDFDPRGGRPRHSFPEYVEAFRAHFERAVQRRLRSAHPVAVSVSGGLDSSAILCLADALRDGPPLLGLTYACPDGSPADETAYLLEIERCSGLVIGRVPVTAPGFANGSRDAIWHTETPQLDEQWHTTRALLQAARQGGARVLLTGHWGDQVLSDQAYLIDLVRTLAWSTVWRHLKERPRWFTDIPPRRLWTQFVTALVTSHLPDRLVRALRALRISHHGRRWYTRRFRRRARGGASPPSVGPGPGMTTSARALYEAVRSSYHVQCMEWNNKVASMHGLDVAFPFLDRDLLSFLLDVPGEIRTWQGVPKALLRESMREVVPGAILRRTWKADFTDRVNAGLQRDYPRLLQHLLGGAAVRWGYVDETRIRAELPRVRHRLRGPTCQLAWTLSTLLALELWLEIFGEARAGRSEMNESDALTRFVMASGG